jgi:AcrR family transcriptional regulator
LTGATRAAAREGGPQVPPREPSVSRNLNGQKLGRKGRDTRARIIAAAAELVARDNDEPVTLSAVAREVGLGMTSLYLYFADLTELLLAVLEPVSAEAEEAYLVLLREDWPEKDLAAHCRRFVEAYHRYWAKHAGLLHLRNAMADSHDERMMQQRVASATRAIGLLAAQMDRGQPADPSGSPSQPMASMLMTMLERSATVWTDKLLHRTLAHVSFADAERFLAPAARLLELGVRDGRLAAAQGRRQS